MARLTKRERNSDGTGIAKFDVTTVDDSLTKAGRNILTKLADYEDLEEHGLLMRLPCKIGAEVFAIFPRDSHYTKCQIKKIEIRPTIFGKICYFAEPVAQRGCCFKYFDNEFDKTIFLTREEAEKKLEEIRNGKK